MPDVTVADRGLREGMLLRMMRDGGRPAAAPPPAATAPRVSALPVDASP